MMERPTSPLVAAVGLVAVTADGVRRLPGLVPAVVHRVDEARHAARERYEELALHGRDVLSGRPAGVAVAEPAANPYAAMPAASVTPADLDADLATDLDADLGTDLGTDVAAGIAAELAGTAVLEPATEPPAPTPPIGLTEPVELPEDLLDEVAQLTPGGELPHSELPLPDFDHLTVPQLRGRLRTLALPQLVQLRDYEQAHAHRLPVLTLLDNRIAKLLAEPDQ